MKKGVIIIVFLAVIGYLAREKVMNWEPIKRYLPPKSPPPQAAPEVPAEPPEKAAAPKKETASGKHAKGKTAPVKVSNSAASIATGLSEPELLTPPKETLTEIEQMLKGGNKVEAWGKLTRKLLSAGSDAERDAVRSALAKLNQETFFRKDCDVEAEFYDVQPGDSLYAIAARYGTTPGLIRWASGKASNKIRERERLKIPLGRLKLLVDKSDFRLYVLLNNRYLKDYAVGIGKDNKTPVGTFIIKTKIEKPDWDAPDGKRYPHGDPKNILGSRWMGFEETAKHVGFGIHGTTLPERIGKAESAGCVCMLDSDVEDLFEAVPRGTEVVIRE